jgi:hypothetical protein
MESVKEVVQSSISFESLFDEHGPAISKELFKENFIKDAQSKGVPLSIDSSGVSGDDVVIKVLDSHESMMYNVFKDNDEYSKWLKQSMHEPTEEEVMSSLRENGTGA